jgi:hypothetical protein
MSDEVIQRLNDYRIDELEAAMVENLDLVECPVTHVFTEGLYTREIFMPAGSLVTSKIHKTEHPFVLSKGKLLVCIDKGEWVEMVAPYTGVTKPGTRRVAYIIEDTIWTTFHANPDDLTDLEEIENLIIEEHENPLLDNVKNLLP